MRRYRFEIRGVVDGVPATAQWAEGRLRADEELRRRAEVVVALGDEFGPDDQAGGRVCAALDADLTAALLTVVRAFSAVESVRIDLRPPEDGGWPGVE